MRKLAALSVIATMLALGGAGATSASTTHSAWSDAAIARGLLCIHRYEGSWQDSGAPYYGGLQMDWNFMQAYGSTFLRRWGHAGHWPVWAQLQAGVTGAKARHGFNPWPRTRIPCGLPYYF